MKNTIKLSFLVIGFLAVLSTQSKQNVTNRLAQRVGICSDLGINPSGKNTQRALCTLVIAVMKALEEVHKRENSLK